MKILHTNTGDVREFIQCCQSNKHIQQVAFSTYHDCLTQICFTCDEIRTSMKEEDLKGEKD